MRCCTHSNTLVGCNKLCRTSSPGIREPRRVDAYAFIYYGCGTHGRNHINNPSPTPRVGVLSQHRVHERFKNIILRSRPFLSLYPSSSTSSSLYFFRETVFLKTFFPIAHKLYHFIYGAPGCDRCKYRYMRDVYCDVAIIRKRILNADCILDCFPDTKFVCFTRRTIISKRNFIVQHFLSYIIE